MSSKRKEINTFVLLNDGVKGIAVDSATSIAVWANDVLMKGVKPAVSLEKYLVQIELHTEHLQAAYDGIRVLHLNATTTQVRTSPKVKARQQFLATMDDTMLMAYAKRINVPQDFLDDVILPDERERLVGEILAVLSKED